MTDDSNRSAVRGLDRINLRLPGETFEAIDAARADRPGAVSRNTWITEAIEEKLAREASARTTGDARRRHA
jgi:metal-responsive CopG/Arc/MetJ family transcriptional regulator